MRVLQIPTRAEDCSWEQIREDKYLYWTNYKSLT